MVTRSCHANAPGAKASGLMMNGRKHREIYVFSCTVGLSRGVTRSHGSHDKKFNRQVPTHGIETASG